VGVDAGAGRGWRAQPNENFELLDSSS